MPIYLLKVVLNVGPSLLNLRRVYASIFVTVEFLNASHIILVN